MSPGPASPAGRDWLHLGPPEEPAETPLAAPLARPRGRVSEALQPRLARLAARARAGWGTAADAARGGIASAAARFGSFGSWIAARRLLSRSPSPSADRPARRWLAWPAATAWRLAALGCVALAGAGAAYLVYCVATIPAEGGITAEPSPSAIFVQAADGQPFATRGVIKGEKLSASELPPNLRAAIVAIEDRRFYEHHGVDLRGIFRAAWRNASGGREGASTITQQLARLSHLSQERSLRRKVQEAWLALRLEWTLAKDEILARYLNSAYFGAGAWGADAAARRYFGKPARELDLSESAILAGLVRAPSSLAPNKNLEGARARAELVLSAMAETGAAPADQIEAARKNPASIWTPPEPPAGTGYFLDYIEAEARRLSKDNGSDLILSSTLDLRLQAAAERVIERALSEEGGAKNVTQAALVALAPDGAVLAMVGGRSYAESQFNRATQAKRQPGSAFKLFVYLAALRQGASPGSGVVDQPVRVGEWEPENYGGRYRGATTLKAAFASSANTVAVQLSEAVGVPAVIRAARELGITSDLPNLPSLALGSAEVTLLEMTRAYAAVAGGAERLDAYGMRKLVRGSDVLAEPRPARQVSGREADVRADMVELLSAVVSGGTGKAARLPAVPVAGKTGTTQENRDAWFIGFTPGLTIGVWVGNDDNTPTRNVTGGDLPARIWKAVASEALRIRPSAIAAPAVRPDSQARGSERAEPAGAGGGSVRGRADVRDTGTLEIGGQEVRLYGIDGVQGRATRDLARYLRRRDVSCEPEGESRGAYRCQVDGHDLSRVVLFNGGGRATRDAPDDLRGVEAQARAAGVGIWGRF